MSARDKFVGIEADFWGCCDAERLTHDDPISAPEGCVEDHLWRGCDVDKEIREMGEVSVDAYSKHFVSDSDVTDIAERALELACERLAEDYGDPDGDHECVSAATQQKHLPAFEATVRALVADATLWRCARTRSVELTSDEVLEIMRVERPDWFEPEAKA